MSSNDDKLEVSSHSGSSEYIKLSNGTSTSSDTSVRKGVKMTKAKIKESQNQYKLMMQGPI